MAMYRLKADHATTADFVPVLRPIAFAGPGPFEVEYPVVAGAHDWIGWEESEAETYLMYNEVFRRDWEAVP